MDHLIAPMNKWLSNKTLWSCLILALTILAMCYEHSFRVCASMAVIGLITLSAVYDDFDPDAKA